MADSSDDESVAEFGENPANRLGGEDAGGHGGAIMCMVLSAPTHKADRRVLLFTGSADRTACCWDVKQRSMERKFRGHSGTVTCLAVAEGRVRALFTGSQDKTLRAWDLRTGFCMNLRKFPLAFW